MNWIDRVMDFLHLLWFEVSQIVRAIWARIRMPFWIYLLVVALCVGAIIASGVVVVDGVVIESNWVIFFGGLVLLMTIIVLGIVLIPVALGINIGRAIYARLFGGRL